MQERINHLPPEMFLLQVTEHCPEAANIYIRLWKRMNSDNKVTILRRCIRSEFLETPTRFLNKLLGLAREALINVHETPKTIQIELVGWDVIDDVV